MINARCSLENSAAIGGCEGESRVRSAAESPLGNPQGTIILITPAALVRRGIDSQQYLPVTCRALLSRGCVSATAGDSRHESFIIIGQTDRNMNRRSEANYRSAENSCETGAPERTNRTYVPRSGASLRHGNRRFEYVLFRTGHGIVCR